MKSREIKYHIRKKYIKRVFLKNVLHYRDRGIQKLWDELVQHFGEPKEVKTRAFASELTQ
jgi:hypothetical protein